MIVKMHKYSFLVFYKEYDLFLESIRQLGVLHVNEKEKAVSEDLKQKLELVKQLEETIQFLESREVMESEVSRIADGVELMSEINALQQKLEVREQDLEETKKNYQKAIVWGNFSPEIIQALKDENIHLRFFTTTKKKYTELLNDDLPIEIISEQGNTIRFMHVQQGEAEIVIKAEEAMLPEIPASILKIHIEEIENEIIEIQELLNEYANDSVPTLRLCKQEMLDSLNMENVRLNTGIGSRRKN